MNEFIGYHGIDYKYYTNNKVNISKNEYLSITYYKRYYKYKKYHNKKEQL